jgi:Flp pilus assembly protein TadD
MSRKLNLVDRLLALGRNLQALGRDYDARQILNRLARFGELPAEVAEETQARLAELHLKNQKYRKARRHLIAALGHRPENARYHYLLAGALDGDIKGNSRRAARHYRRSLALDPNQPRCLGEFGLLCLRLGRPESGLKALRRAVKLAPDDPQAVGNLVEGLRQEGRIEEAQQVLRAARFRNPRDARFQKLMQDFQFDQLRQQQEAARQTGAAPEAGPAGPVLLRFVRPAPEIPPAGANGKTVRRDAASPPPAPYFPRNGRRPGQKRAQ